VSLTRRIRENRPTVVFVVIVLLSLISLASGTEATFIGDGVRTGVHIVTYPFRIVFGAAEKGINYVGGLIFNYNSLREELATHSHRNAQLAAEVAEKDELLEENRRLRGMMEFDRAESELTFFPAEVIRSSTGKLTIDLGAMHGLEELMGVMTDQGVVGVVTEVQPFESLVFTLHNSNCHVEAMIERNRVRGFISGSTAEDHFSTMEYIDLKDEIREGDQIVTGPNSLFPTGIPIGTIATPPTVGSLYKTAFVEPAVDPYRLDEVFVVQRRPMGDTAENLEDEGSQIEDPAPQSGTGGEETPTEPIAEVNDA